MNNKELIENLKELLSKNLENVIDELDIFSKIVKPENSFKNDLVHLRSRMSDLQQAEIKGIINIEDARLEKARIRNATLNLIDKIGQLPEYNYKLHEPLKPEVINTIKQIAKNTIVNQNLINAMEVQDFPFSNEIIDLNNNVEYNEIIRLGEVALIKYKQMDDYQAMSSLEFYLIAKVLLKAIEENNSPVFKDKPFIYAIHQILSKLIRTSNEKEVLSNELVAWLKDKTIYPTSRDFAAFELGMSRCNGAVWDLLKASTDAEENYNVRNYAIMALGMINDNKVLIDLVNLYNSNLNDELRKTLAHVIIFISKQPAEIKYESSNEKDDFLEQMKKRKIESLKKLLLDNYDLLEKYQQRFNLEEDPKRKARLKMEIDDIKSKIKEDEDELKSIACK
jgi:hypothetical protein